jgi:hypothetical protein
MPVTHKVDFDNLLGGGFSLIGGTLVMDSAYATSGEVMNLANRFSPSTTPTVVISAADGYMLEHNHGTANAGTVIARYSAGNALNGASFIIPLVEVAASANLAAVNTTWFAIGQSIGRL